MRIAIDPIAKPIGPVRDEHDDWQAVPGDFLVALSAARRFIGKAPKARVERQVAFLHESSLYVTNDQVVVEYRLEPNGLPAAAFTPKDISTLVALGLPSDMRATADMTEFRWADGSTFLMIHADHTDPARYSMLEGSKYSDTPSASEIVSLIEKLWVEPSVEIDDDWRKTTLATFNQPGIEILHFKGNHVIAEVGDRDGLAATIGVDLGASTPDMSVSSRDFLRVLEFAEELGFSDGSPRRATFRFAGGRGVIVGQQPNELGYFFGSVDFERGSLGSTKA